MEINGHPYYIKSKGSVPYLYDVDTNDEVGYWSSKKGQYIMFSLYNKIMKKKYEDIGDSIDSSESIKTQKGSESGSEKERAGSESSDSGSESSDSCSESSDSGSESSDSCSESSDSGSKSEITSEKTKNKMNYSFVFVFIVFFVYLTLQKEFQSIYFDFIFLIFINMLHILKVFEMLGTIDE
jgi:cobalamin biosynthesis Mg chelatase CobN